MQASAAARATECLITKGDGTSTIAAMTPYFISALTANAAILCRLQPIIPLLRKFFMQYAESDVWYVPECTSSAMD